MKQAIVFAFYKEGKLFGFRQDSFGSIGLQPKIYHYSESQVKTVLENVFHNCEEARKSFVEEVADAASAASEGALAVMVGSFMSRSAKMVKDLGEFEVRILPCPDYEEATEENPLGVYPTQALLEWLGHPQLPPPIEIHKFKV